MDNISFNKYKNMNMQQNTNTNTSHPLIPSSQEYMYYKKFVSIHSEDRDVTKYPQPGKFIIELPEDYLNVAAIKLINWSFPANYNTFSIFGKNIEMTFTINNPYNPGANSYYDTYTAKVFECLFLSQSEEFRIFIEQGFYNPVQMVTELTNKFNFVVTTRLSNYFNQQIIENPNDLTYQVALNTLIANGGYSNFIIVYNNVSQKIWFGNTTDGFTLTNETILIQTSLNDNYTCGPATSGVPDFTNWGLPGSLGLSRLNTSSTNQTTIDSSYVLLGNYASYYVNGVSYTVPRFYYGDVLPGDSGFWLLPNTNLPGCLVNWIECPYKINLMGEAYIYMEIAGLNCIDETSPYNLSTFTYSSNITNGVVNSSFAKLPVPSTPISQWFDRDSVPYKYFYPPAERIRKLDIKFRYHNGMIVEFGLFNYSFTIEFILIQPQMLREAKTAVYPLQF